MTSQGGYHMDVNATSGRGTQHSEAKKQELMKNDQCFYCEVVGHRTKDCRKKTADCHPFNGRRTDNPGKGRPSLPIYNRASDDTPKFNISPGDISSFLKENMDTISKDNKLSIINSLMLKGFCPAQN